MLVPAARLAGTHTAAVAGAVAPFCAARCSPDAVDDGGLHEQHPGCSEPARKKPMFKNYL